MTVPPRMSSWATWTLRMIFVLHVVLAALLAWNNRFAIEPDGVAYVRIATYYATGQTEHLVSGYWGPLLSWLMAPAIVLIDNPLFASRLVMVLSAAVFVAGSVAVFRRLELPDGAVLLGAAAAAVMAARHAADRTTPDLLAAGLLCFGFARLLGRSWPVSRREPVVTGLLFGLAYLAKAVALPVFAVATVLAAVLHGLARPGERPALARAALVSVAACAVTIAPWVTILSLEYGGPTVSTSARINHTLVGPDDVDRSHPTGNRLEAPAPGRITQWEDPTRLAYPHWSPLESGAYFAHQVRVVAANVGHVFAELAAFDWMRLGACALFVAILPVGPWRRLLAEQRWRWAVVAVAATCSVYLPFYAVDTRYYFAAFPFLIVATIGMVLMLTAGVQEERWGRVGRAGAVLVAGLSFMVPAATEVPALLARNGEPPAAIVVARGLAEAGIAGPVAGDTVESMLVAFALDEPCYGGVPWATPDDFRASGAEIVVVFRHAAIARRLARADDFEDLDDVVFDSPAAAARCPSRVFRVRRTPDDAPVFAGASEDETGE